MLRAATLHPHHPASHSRRGFLPPAPLRRSLRKGTASGGTMVPPLCWDNKAAFPQTARTQPRPKAEGNSQSSPSPPRLPRRPISWPPSFPTPGKHRLHANPCCPEKQEGSTSPFLPRNHLSGQKSQGPCPGGQEVNQAVVAPAPAFLWPISNTREGRGSLKHYSFGVQRGFPGSP